MKHNCLVLDLPDERQEVWSFGTPYGPATVRAPNITEPSKGHRLVAFDTIGSGVSNKPGITYGPSILIDCAWGFTEVTRSPKSGPASWEISGSIGSG